MNENQTVSRKDGKLRNKAIGDVELDVWGRTGLRIEFIGEVKSVEYFLEVVIF